MNIHDLRLLVDYHYWARDRLLEAIERLTSEQYNKDVGCSFGSIRGTVVHLYGADWVWCNRWEGNPPAPLPDPKDVFPDLPSIRAAWSQHEQKVRALLERLGEVGILQPIEYQREGKTYAEPFWQQLQHVVNHGSYHRGQVTTMLRQLGAAPPRALDLIAFYRERANVIL